MSILIRKDLLDETFREECIGECGCCSNNDEDSGCKLIIDAPVVDAVEVIRCKDCGLFGRSPFNHPTLGWCRVYGSHRNPQFFCAFAEPKPLKTTKPEGRK